MLISFVYKSCFFGIKSNETYFYPIFYAVSEVTNLCLFDMDQVLFRA